MTPTNSLAEENTINKKKSRQITSRKKGLPTFKSSEDYLSLKDHEYVKDHPVAVDFRRSSSLDTDLHALEKLQKTLKQEIIDDEKRRLRNLENNIITGE